jgi:glycogen synthase
VWKKIIKRAMQMDFSWKKSAQKYVELYKKAMELHNDNLTLNSEQNRPLYS